MPCITAAENAGTVDDRIVLRVAGVRHQQIYPSGQFSATHTAEPPEPFPRSVIYAQLRKRRDDKAQLRSAPQVVFNFFYQDAPAQKGHALREEL